jgi:hypothetical protein
VIRARSTEPEQPVTEQYVGEASSEAADGSTDGICTLVSGSKKRQCNAGYTDQLADKPCPDEDVPAPPENSPQERCHCHPVLSAALTDREFHSAINL